MRKLIHIVLGAVVGLVVAVVGVIALTYLGCATSKGDPSCAAAGPFVLMAVAPIALIIGAVIGYWRARKNVIN